MAGSGIHIRADLRAGLRGPDGGCPCSEQIQAPAGAEGKLCLNCHPDFAEKLKSKFVHTPVKTTECSGCHNPHASRHGKLLFASRRRSAPSATRRSFPTRRRASTRSPPPGVREVPRPSRVQPEGHPGQGRECALRRLPSHADRRPGDSEVQAQPRADGVRLVP